jgi:RNA polymerase sigma-70 factor (ECF subfamily)
MQVGMAMSVEAETNGSGGEGLLVRLRAGDQAAELEFDRRWRSRLLEVTRSILHDENLAEDATQLALWRALLNLDRFDSSRPFEPWILAIARNCARDLRRREPKLVVGNAQWGRREAVSATNGASDSLKGELLEALRACMEGLNERSRTVVALLMTGFSLSETGRALRRPKNTVQGWLRNALEQLHRCMIDKGFTQIE